MKDKSVDNELKYYETEYQMLKDAHFQTSKQITSFFQFSLLIFSAPFALLSANGITYRQLGAVFIVIGFVSQLVMWYLSRMRCEALLYARQINRIRSILYSNYLFNDDNDTSKIHEKRILLSQEEKPDYSDKTQFKYIVLALDNISSFYLTFGLYRFCQGYSVQCFVCEWMINNSYIFIIIAFIIIHIGIYIHRRIALHCENGQDYFHRIIGVDIDGVLNKHELQFTNIYNKLFDSDFCVDKITTLPVHKSGIISRENEQKVFEQKDYWIKMPVNEDASFVLNKQLHEKLGFKIYLFTWRDWDLNHRRKWMKLIASVNLQQKIKKILSRKEMKRSTKKWLKENSLNYQRIRFDYGNIDRPIRAFTLKYRTRFFYAKKFKIKYFIEDDPNNAIKLSKICDYVFLISHKYNEHFDFPYNVIRVTNWNEIYNKIREFE